VVKVANRIPPQQILTYLHLLGMEADGGGLGKTLATSDRWWSHAFRFIKFRAVEFSPRPPDCGFSLRRYGCSLVNSCSLNVRLWSWSWRGRGVALRTVEVGAGVMNSITLSDLVTGSGKWNITPIKNNKQVTHCKSVDTGGVRPAKTWSGLDYII